MRYRKERLSGWAKYPVEDGFVFRPEKTSDLDKILNSSEFDTYISRGLGRSYGDTALNNQSGVILNLKQNRFLGFDPETCILECEAGVSLEEIIEFFLPKGYFLPVTPGTKYVTLAGAIANDVHGKNHHRDGCISEHIVEFKLYIASGEILTCSRNENNELFWATVGGIGLTGVIVSIKIKLIKVKSSQIEVDYKKARNIEEAFELFETTDQDYQYSVAWIDCVSKGKNLGRSVLMLGNHSTNDEKLEVTKKRKINMAVDLPSFALNHVTVKSFNELYYQSYRDNSKKLVDYDSFFYPLDSILNWNRMYGKRGFIQYQFVLPPETSKKGLRHILEKLSNSKRSSFLAVLKSFKQSNNGLLSFPTKGYTLALDIPIKNESLFSFVKELDQLVLSYGGRIYLAKDAEMDSKVFEQMYPTLDKFKKIKKEVDPTNIFSSSMSRRLGITE
jgi:decaprenylphospho-beta-D-ribofuranose 2-oxidase